MGRICPILRHMTYLTVEDVAHQLHVTRATVSRWIRTGELAASKIGRRWILTEADVADFVGRNHTTRKRRQRL